MVIFTEERTMQVTNKQKGLTTKYIPTKHVLSITKMHRPTQFHNGL